MPRPCSSMAAAWLRMRISPGCVICSVATMLPVEHAPPENLLLRRRELRCRTWGLARKECIEAAVAVGVDPVLDRALGHAEQPGDV